MESAASCISFPQKRQWNVQLFHSQNVFQIMYSKLVDLFWKRHSVSDQFFKWLPKSPFSIDTPQLHEDLDQTGNYIKTTPGIPSFCQGVICHILPSQFGVHREQRQGVKLGNSKIANYNSSRIHRKKSFGSIRNKLTVPWLSLCGCHWALSSLGCQSF